MGVGWAPWGGGGAPPPPLPRHPYSLGTSPVPCATRLYLPPEFNKKQPHPAHNSVGHGPLFVVTSALAAGGK